MNNLEFGVQVMQCIENSGGNCRQNILRYRTIVLVNLKEQEEVL
jgi:hypothetical protein